MKQFQWLFIGLICMVSYGVSAEMKEIDLVEGSIRIVRVIIKETPEGYYLVQDFYKEGKRRTEPFLLKNKDQINSLAYDQLNLESHFILWRSNGRKWQEGYYMQGKRAGQWTHWN